MHEAYRIHTTFVTERGIYCYKVMPFGLKNARATYQRLINKMFFRLMGSMIEAYIDDMVIKGKMDQDHLRDADEVFEIFRNFWMKPPEMCLQIIFYFWGTLLVGVG